LIGGEKRSDEEGGGVEKRRSENHKGDQTVRSRMGGELLFLLCRERNRARGGKKPSITGFFCLSGGRGADNEDDISGGGTNTFFFF